MFIINNMGFEKLVSFINKSINNPNTLRKLILKKQIN